MSFISDVLGHTENYFALQRQGPWHSSVVGINDSFGRLNRRDSVASRHGAIGDGSPRRRDKLPRHDSSGTFNSLQRGLYPMLSQSSTPATNATPTTASSSSGKDPFDASMTKIDISDTSNNATADTKLQLDELLTGVSVSRPSPSLRRGVDTSFQYPALISAPEKTIYESPTAIRSKPSYSKYTSPQRSCTTNGFSPSSTVYHPNDQIARSRPSFVEGPSFASNHRSSGNSSSSLNFPGAERLVSPQASAPASLPYHNYLDNGIAKGSSNSGQPGRSRTYDYLCNSYSSQSAMHDYPNGLTKEAFPNSSENAANAQFTNRYKINNGASAGAGAGTRFTGDIRSSGAPLLPNRHDHSRILGVDEGLPEYDTSLYQPSSYSASARNLKQSPSSYEDLRMKMRYYTSANNATIADMIQKEKWQDAIAFLQRSHASHLLALSAEYENQIRSYFSASRSLVGKQEALTLLHNHHQRNQLSPYQYQPRTGVRKGQRWIRDPLIPVYQEGYPLFLVSFKNDRVDIFYTLPASRTHMPRLPQLGDSVRVEGDRGDNVGIVIGMHTRICEAKSIKAELAMKQRKKLMSKFAMRRATMGGSCWSFDKAAEMNMAGYYANYNNNNNFNNFGGHDGVSNNGSDCLIDGNLDFSKSKDQPWPAFLRDIIPQNAMFYDHLSNKEAMEQAAYTIAQQKVLEYEFPMEILNVDIQWDGNKVTCYYYSESYINFQPLVNRLHALFNVRIWMSAINPASMKKRSSDLSLLAAWK